MKKITNFTLSALFIMALPNLTAQVPWSGLNDSLGISIFTIPGKIEIEYFDDGGNAYDPTGDSLINNPTAAYYDDTERKTGTSTTVESFRPDEDVDIQAVVNYDSLGVNGLKVGWVSETDWLLYSVNVTPGDYRIMIWYATPQSNRTLYLELLNKDKEVVQILVNDTVETTGSNFNFDSTAWRVSILVTGEHYLKFSNPLKGIGVDYIIFDNNLSEFEGSTSSIENLFQTSELSVYPNPATEKLSISGLTGNADINIYSTTGVIVKTVHNLSISENTLDISKLKAGMYYVSIKTQNKDIIKKVLIK